MLGRLLILSGPAGSGKTTLANAILKHHHPRIQRAITATTRPPRIGEISGKDYHFLTLDQFQSYIAEGAFYEYAHVHNQHWYGTLKSSIDGPLAAGIDILCVIDVQGAAAFRLAARMQPQLKVHTFFILPPDLETLRDRLHKRNSETPADIERRLQTAQKELSHNESFDHRIVTSTPKADYQAFLAIYQQLPRTS